MYLLVAGLRNYSDIIPGSKGWYLTFHAEYGDSQVDQTLLSILWCCWEFQSLVTWKQVGERSLHKTPVIMNIHKKGHNNWLHIPLPKSVMQDWVEDNLKSKWIKNLMIWFRCINKITIRLDKYTHSNDYCNPFGNARAPRVNEMSDIIAAMDLILDLPNTVLGIVAKDVWSWLGGRWTPCYINVPLVCPRARA